MLYYWTHDAVVHSEKVCECKSIEHPKPRERSFSHENRHFFIKKEKETNNGSSDIFEIIWYLMHHK